MRTLNNEITIHRGETFSMDKIIVNKDNSPYIISSELRHPYWLLTISTTKYVQANRYIKNYWLDLSNFPRFASTQPVNIADFKTSDSGSKDMYTDFSDMTYDESTDTIATGYIDGFEVTYSPTDAVFYKETDDGVEYKYYSVSANTWLDYVCRITISFSTADTNEWVEQSYVYSIDLVDGDTTDGDRSIIVDWKIPILIPTKLSVLSNIQGGA